MSDGTELTDTGTEYVYQYDYSYDTDGVINQFLWDFGDDVTADQANPSHQYKNSGIYTVSLVVQDDDGSKRRQGNT